MARNENQKQTLSLMIQEPILRLGPELFILLATHPAKVAKDTGKADLGLICPLGAVVPRRNTNDSKFRSHKVPIRNKGASARRHFHTSEPIPARVPHGEEWIRLKSATHFFSDLNGETRALVREKLAAQTKA